jgi:hypothetical protein
MRRHPGTIAAAAAALTTLTAALAAAPGATAAATRTGAPRTSTATAAVHGAAAPYCGIHWGSLARSHGSTAVAALTGVRAGRHPCFDRLVIDVRGRADGYRVEYVTAVTADGSGDAVPLRGGARLAVVVVAPAHDDAYRPTYLPANRREVVDVTGYRTVRQVAWAGSREGRSTIGLGVRARLPFRVFTLAGPGTGSRIVVDVAHRW